MIEFYAAGFVILCRTLQGVRMGLINLEATKALASLGASDETPPPIPPQPATWERLLGMGRMYDAVTPPKYQKGLEEAEAKFREAKAKLRESAKQLQDTSVMAESLTVSLELACEQLKTLRLIFSLAEAERMHRRLKERLPTGEEVDALLSRIHDELSEHLFLQISINRVQFYNPKEFLFGNEVEVKFPSVIYEIDEAGKCLALDRPTASAFHAIRCLEAGIGALSRCLGIPDPTKANERNWGKVLDKVKTEVDRRWPTNSNRLSGDGEFFDRAYGAMAGMQNPYRNATMHLDQKYTDEEAMHILEIVKGFMMKLASRMDEQGQPLA